MDKYFEAPVAVCEGLLQTTSFDHQVHPTRMLIHTEPAIEKKCCPGDAIRDLFVGDG